MTNRFKWPEDENKTSLDKAVDAVMDTIEKNGRIVRDDLVQALRPFVPKAEPVFTGVSYQLKKGNKILLDDKAYTAGHVAEIEVDQPMVCSEAANYTAEMLRKAIKALHENDQDLIGTGAYDRFIVDTWEDT